ncbi:uncharacterized protein LOC128998611 [Macrosteles quadrilineatus]|uniref:uncharacterized protein LOC128998611 n=1 Tax=Macrosteles quadrilineatus TaxID=74068 RepID=UPI0023E0FA70|nr:uncharacterized protein LOC128998611 [Macrosteles quadrilineatus]
MNGLIRCKGRISNADLEEYCKFPILLPKNDLFTQLLIEECHCKIFHMGVQQTLSELRKSFWIIHGRAEVNRVLRKCLKCLKYEGGPYKLPQIPSLPTERVTESIPFQFTGLDYFGPLYIKSFQASRVEVSKVYGCIFTCLVTRAVHLEITNNLSSEEFLLSLRRFVGRRGTPKKIYLDNATQFKKASSFLNDMFVEHLDTPELLSYVSENHIEFTYIPEFAPWMGGMYERLISLIKRCLRKSIGSVTLTKSQLDTVMIEIEAVVNSRPLVYVSSSDQSLTDFIITPGHFLNFHGKNGFVNSLNECQENDMEFISKVTESDLLKMWKKGTNNLNSFWKIWKKDYLLSLRERTQHNIKQGRILSTQHPQVGDVVHVHDTLPRGTWRLGKIEVLNVSADGNVRSAKLKLGSGKYITRPINLLYPIEVSDHGGRKKQSLT